MSFSTHARCDWCESVLHVGDEDELLEEGWLTATYGISDEDSADFCSLTCLVSWASSDSARELVSQALEREDDD